MTIDINKLINEVTNEVSNEIITESKNKDKDKKKIKKDKLVKDEEDLTLKEKSIDETLGENDETLGDNLYTRFDSHILSSSIGAGLGALNIVKKLRNI